MSALVGRPPKICRLHADVVGLIASEQLAREAFDLAAAKLPVQTTFVKRSVM